MGLHIKTMIYQNQLLSINSKLQIELFVIDLLECVSR